MAISPQTTSVIVGFDVSFSDPVPGAATAPFEITEPLQDGFAAANQGRQASDGFSIGLVVSDRLCENHF